MVVIFTRSDFHPEVNWSTGMVLLWSLLMTLSLPWFDDGSVSHPLFTPLWEAVPAQLGIIVSQGFG
jgi:hypothetical protein